jgi:ribosomal protein S18 acetylase RimI-like enzyme
MCGQAESVNRTQDPTILIRPAGPADLATLGDFFAGLSVQTRYRRFFAAYTPTGAVLRMLAGGAGNVDAVIAVREGVIIGHAMASDRAGPGGTRMTDVGVVIADAWQGHGAGSALIRTLINRACSRGVTCVTMDVLHSNHRVLGMITRRWPAARAGHSTDFATVHVWLPVDQAGSGRHEPSKSGAGPSKPAAAAAAWPAALEPTAPEVSPAGSVNRVPATATVSP